MHGDSLRKAVKCLRQRLGESAGCLVSPADGYTYKFSAGPDAVDAAVFAGLHRRARVAWYGGDVDSAARLLAAAAGLWRDPALDDVPATPVLKDLREALIRARVDVEDMWMDARLELGGHHAAIEDLRETLRRDRLREHAWAQLMIALSRAGRRAEALQAFDDACTALKAEYGCGPGPWLTEIRSQITADSPALAAYRPGLTLAGAGRETAASRES